MVAILKFKMNKKKSELLWVGQAKRSKSKLCKNIKLPWGATEFEASRYPIHYKT